MNTLKLLFAGSRSACLAFEDGSLYRTAAPFRVRVNGEEAGLRDTAVFSLYRLPPDTDIEVEARGERLCFRTEAETVTLDVRRFGAAGDGEHDDTPAIQAAIQCCPPGGRVLIPAGRYRVLPLFLKSRLRLEIRRGAVLKLESDRRRLPVLPGTIQGTGEGEELRLGTWEGNPLDMYAALLTGVDCEDVQIWGEGVLDGGASRDNWWLNPKVRRGAWRPRMIFLNRCKGVTVQGLTVCSSPSWNLHPFFSDDLRFLNLKIQAPADSPNTDGFDPESCRRVLLAGTHFSLGDDCIAIKSGKIWMGAHFGRPCEQIEIAHCLMENGHGGVTIGSEMSGGVRDVRVRDCLMRRTDRGLRVKTRRGRGEQGVIDRITFERVRMEQVLAPLVVNALYYCDPDGHSAFVQSREKQPVDSGTPRIGEIAFRDVTAEGASCAGYVLGLPERPVERLVLERVRIDCAPEAPAIVPAMAEGVPALNRTGVHALNVAEIAASDVEITGIEGDAIVRE